MKATNLHGSRWRTMCDGRHEPSKNKYISISISWNSGYVEYDGLFGLFQFLWGPVFWGWPDNPSISNSSSHVWAVHMFEGRLMVFDPQCIQLFFACTQEQRSTAGEGFQGKLIIALPRQPNGRYWDTSVHRRFSISIEHMPCHPSFCSSVFLLQYFIQITINLLSRASRFISHHHVAFASICSFWCAAFISITKCCWGM